MQLELISMQKEVGITFVYVTHDQTEALALSHRIAVMNRGRVEQVDAPDRLYGFPSTRFVADFIGTCNLLVGPVVDARTAAASPIDGAPTSARSWSQRDAQARAAGAEGAVALRPEKVRLAAPGAATPRGQPVRGHGHRTSSTTATSRSTACAPRAGTRWRRCSPNSGAGPRQVLRDRRSRSS